MSGEKLNYQITSLYIEKIVPEILNHLNSQRVESLSSKFLSDFNNLTFKIHTIGYTSCLKCFHQMAMQKHLP